MILDSTLSYIDDIFIFHRSQYVERLNYKNYIFFGDMSIYRLCIILTFSGLVFCCASIVSLLDHHSNCTICVYAYFGASYFMVAILSDYEI